MKSLSSVVVSLLVAWAMIVGEGCALAFQDLSEFKSIPWQPLPSGAPFCSPLLPPDKRVKQIKSGDADGLWWAAQNSAPGTTLLLEDGVYRFPTNQMVDVDVPYLTIRSLSGNRDAVIIEGGYSNLTINVSGVTVADVTLRNPYFHNLHIRGENGVTRTRIYNVHALDAGQQLIKVSTGDGRSGKFADEGLVACSLLEFSTYAKGLPGVTGPDYTDGVDLLAGKGWVIRDNVFRRIRSWGGPAGPAILIWKNAMDTIIVRNLIVDCWRGIALGLSPPDAISRGGPGVVYDHQNGLVENNVILALREPADAAIENTFAHNSQVLHNTVYYREGLPHMVNWSIEYRFRPTTAVIKNNLTNLPILKRAPFPAREATLGGNLAKAQASWFRNVIGEDVHLMPGVPAIDGGVLEPASSADFGGVTRPAGQAPDVGAYEFVTKPDGTAR